VSYLSSHVDVAGPRFTGHVWRDDGGQINGTVDITRKTGPLSCWLCFDDPADARELAAACTAAAEAMEQFAAQPETPVTQEG
jgi:hypothetical protein